jgi:hypothetical protein
MPKLWNKKPIAVLQAEAADPTTQELLTHGSVPLKRTLSAKSLVALGIGNIIGAGIFVLTGQAAAAHAGPAIGLSFMISANYRLGSASRIRVGDSHRGHRLVRLCRELRQGLWHHGAGRLQRSAV